ncbi:multicopper oxidase family protein [Thalassobacillus devorans]|uniref:multicopper oxidase family protein n=1 Tax=Thalassobacillus devorans TaxID=279813 RepID=UPI0004BCCCE8|nr:copper oxidase [Thalassobacillus devorans]
MKRKWIITLVALAAIGSTFIYQQLTLASTSDTGVTAPASKSAPIESPGVETLHGEEEDGVKRFELTAEPVTQTFTSGYQGKAWGYNGSTPGPTLVAEEGDKVEITVTNNLPEATSVHWHGLKVPNDMDGVTSIQDTPTIEPGESFTYTFTLEQSGTYMYHSHTNVSKQELMGLGGAFVIQPKKQNQQVDRDIVMMLQEWTLEGAGGHGDMEMAMPSSDKEANDEEHSEKEGMTAKASDDSGAYEINPMGMEPNTFTINGKSYPDTEPIQVKRGETVRLRFTNLSGNSHPMHMHGDDFKVVAADGNRIDASAQLTKNTINVAAGETWDVEFTAENVGKWPIHCHKPHHTMNANGDTGGMFTVIEVVE